MSVVVCHAIGWKPGAAGVDLFFVISGFVIGKAMAGRMPGSFLFDRFWRIFPFYWVCAALWFGVVAWSNSLTLGRTLTSITLWPVFGQFTVPYLQSGWSLSYELLFYAAATLALLTRRGGWLIAAFVLCFAAALINPAPLLGFLGFPLVFDFLFGLLIGKLPTAPTRVALMLLVAPLIMLLAPAAVFDAHSFGVADSVTVMRLVLWGVPAAVILYAALGIERFATSEFAISLGDASYSIYLTHQFVLIFVTGWLAVPIAAAVGLIVRRFVERPLLRMKPHLRFDSHNRAIFVGRRCAKVERL